MKKIMVYLIVLLIIGCSVYRPTNQNDAQKYCRIDANTVIKISCLLISQKKIRDIISSYSNVSDTFIVNNPFDTSMVMDTAISFKRIVQEDYVIYFYDYPELIVFEKKAWLEYEKITIKRNRIHVEYKIIVRYPKLSSIKVLKADFKCVNNEIRIISLDL